MLDQLKEKFEKMYQQDIELPEYFGRRYDVVSCIKHTEQKQVYLLREKNDGKKAVLKCGFGMYRATLKEEYRTLCRLAGEGFPEVYAWEELPDRCFLVREYVEGDTLQELMEREETLSAVEALETAEQVCGLLDRLHSQNPPVIYRDVKPQNVVRTPQGNHILIDLDTARRYKDGAGEDTVFMGTRGYASPEQFGFQQTDARTDVYGLGMLLLYLLTGGYEKGKTFESLPKNIKRIISKCTEFNPKDRYSTINEVRHALQRLSGVKKQQELLRKRKKILQRIGIAVLLCAVAAGTVFCVRGAQYRRNIVEFSNPVIERAVRQQLRKKDGSPVMTEDLDNVYTLAICGDMTFQGWTEVNEFMAFNWYVTNNWTQPEDPFDMSDLSKFTNINTLIIEYQNIREIPDLSHLPLIRVDFSNNSLTDVSGISECTEIKTLHLRDNPIEDLSALQNLDKIEQLDISFTQVSDLSPVVSDKLKALYMEYSNLEDFSVLKACPNIEDIRVSNATKEEIAQLSCIENLKNFSVYEGEVDSLEMFLNVPHLQGLELAGCAGLTSLEGIENFPELGFLGLAGTGISSFPEHFYHDNLEVLELTGTSVTDFKALLRCPKLRNLYVSEEVEPLASRQLENSNIQVEGIK